jgi:hypothetical protein
MRRVDDVTLFPIRKALELSKTREEVQVSRCGINSVNKYGIASKVVRKGQRQEVIKNEKRGSERR